MKTFTVQIQYLLPIYANITVEANDATAAVKKALEIPFRWDNAREDVESSSPEYAVAVVDGDVEPYHPGVGDNHDFEHDPETMLALDCWFGTVRPVI